FLELSQPKGQACWPAAISDIQTSLPSILFLKIKLARAMPDHVTGWKVLLSGGNQENYSFPEEKVFANAATLILILWWDRTLESAGLKVLDTVVASKSCL